MARQIIVTHMTKQPDGDTSLSWVFWLSVPAFLQTQFLNGTSSVPVVSAAVPWGITTIEQTALTNGTVTEQAGTGQLPPGASASAVEAYLQTAYTAAQTALNATAPTKAYIGCYYDSSTGWTNVPA